MEIFISCHVYNTTGNVRVTLRHVRATIFAVEKQ